MPTSKWTVVPRALNIEPRFACFQFSQAQAQAGRSRLPCAGTPTIEARPCPLCLFGDFCQVLAEQCAKDRRKAYGDAVHRRRVLQREAAARAVARCIQAGDGQKVLVKNLLVAVDIESRKRNEDQVCVTRPTS